MCSDRAQEDKELEPGLERAAKIENTHNIHAQKQTIRGRKEQTKH